jgi:uncharacterized membrane protein YoaK (UPF0700 family)
MTLSAGRGVAAGLGFIAGFVDAFGFLRWHVFGANMTGNTIMFAISLPTDARHALLPLSLIAVFIAGCGLGRAVVDRLVPVVGLVGEAALLTAAAFVPGYAALEFIALAMGMQNSLVATFAGVQANTSFVSGDYTKIGQAVADFALRGGSEESRRTLSILTPLIAAYALGAVLSAFCKPSLAVLAVVPIVLAVAYASYRGHLE